MLGIILCGGRSTRLPYKLFLSNKRGVILPLAAVQMFQSSGLNEIKICVHANDKFFHSLFGHIKNVTLEEDDYIGLLPLLNRLAIHDDLIVICGDNAYGLLTKNYIRSLKDSVPKKMQLVINTTTIITPELHGWANSYWAEKGDSNALYPLTTPWFIPKKTWFEKSLIETFNSYKAIPIALDDTEWSDLGTPNSVKEYYDIYDNT